MTTVERPCLVCPAASETFLFILINPSAVQCPPNTTPSTSEGIGLSLSPKDVTGALTQVQQLGQYIFSLSMFLLGKQSASLGRQGKGGEGREKMCKGWKENYRVP